MAYYIEAANADCVPACGWMQNEQPNGEVTLVVSRERRVAITPEVVDTLRELLTAERR